MLFGSYDTSSSVAQYLSGDDALISSIFTGPFLRIVSKILGEILFPILPYQTKPYYLIILLCSEIVPVFGAKLSEKRNANVLILS